LLPAIRRCSRSCRPLPTSREPLASSWPTCPRRSSPFDDGSVKFVYLAHALEHFEYPEEALALVKNIHRVLADGGRPARRRPDIRQCSVAYAGGDDGFFDKRGEYWPAAARLATTTSNADAAARPGWFRARGAISLHGERAPGPEGRHGEPARRVHSPRRRALLTVRRGDAMMSVRGATGRRR
jgi:hypothetical protein